jgi:hypothetical protein
MKSSKVGVLIKFTEGIQSRIEVEVLFMLRAEWRRAERLSSSSPDSSTLVTAGIGTLVRTAWTLTPTHSYRTRAWPSQPRL